MYPTYSSMVHEMRFSSKLQLSLIYSKLLCIRDPLCTVCNISMLWQMKLGNDRKGGLASSMTTTLPFLFTCNISCGCSIPHIYNITEIVSCDPFVQVFVTCWKVNKICLNHIVHITICYFFYLDFALVFYINVCELYEYTDLPEQLVTTLSYTIAK